MVERAHRPTQAKQPVKRGGSRVRRDDSAEASHATGAAGASDPNAASRHMHRLRRLAEKADRGETVDGTGMTGEEFLKAFTR